MRMFACPVPKVTAPNPVKLAKARQLVSVRSAVPEDVDSTPKPVKQSDAVQLLIHPVADPLPVAKTKTPEPAGRAPPSDSVNRESCANRLALALLVWIKRPLSQLRTSVSVTQRFPRS